MPNEKKKSYREIAENNMIPRNTLLKDVYAKLEQTSEADMQARITEIREALEVVDRNTARMQRRMRSKAVREDKAANDALEEISLIGTRLENEAEMLDSFPRVRATLMAIKSAEWKKGRELIQIEQKTREAEAMLTEAQEAAEKAKEAEEKAREIEAQIAEIKSEMEEAKAKGRKQKIIDAYQEEIDEKEAEREALGTPEDWKKAIEGVQEAEDKVKSSKDKEEEARETLGALQKPWDTILKGYLWSEIGDLTNKDLSIMTGVKVQREEAKWEEKPEGKGKDKEEGDKKGKGANNNQVQYQNPNPNPVQPTPPNPAPELEPDEEEQELDPDDQEPDEPELDQELDDDELDNPDEPQELPEKQQKGIFARISNWWKQGKAREAAFIEAFRKENKGEPSWFQKLKARFSRKLIAIEYAEPERSEEDLARARELIARNGIARELAKQRQEQIREQYKTEEEQIAAITQELSTMTSEEIVETAPLWEGLLSETAINMAYNAALMREKPKSEKAKKYEQEIAEAKGEVPPSRQAHRDFAEKINGGAEIPTPEVEHIDAEVVSRGDYARATGKDTVIMDDPFEEEK